MILTVALLLAMSAPDDHLVPYDGPFINKIHFHSCEDGLAHLLLEPGPRYLQMIAVYPDRGEASVFVVEEAGRFTVVAKNLQSSLGAASLALYNQAAGLAMSDLQKTRIFEESCERALKAQREPERRVAPLQTATFVAIDRLWRAALKQVRRKEPVVENGELIVRVSERGGVAYHFANFERDLGYRDGFIGVPEAGTRMAALAAIGEKLMQLPRATETERAGMERELQAAAGSLLRRFE